MTDAGVMERVDEALDFSPNIECEARDECTNTAEWVAFCPMCGGDVTFCVGHKDEFMAQAAAKRIARHGGSGGCGQLMPIDQVRWEPLP